MTDPDDLVPVTVHSDRQFSRLDLELLIESIQLFMVGSGRMAIGIADSDGDPVNISQWSGEEMKQKLSNNEFHMIPLASKAPFTEEEVDALDDLSGLFIGGLGELDDKQTKIIENEISPKLIDELYQFLKKERKEDK